LSQDKYDKSSVESIFNFAKLLTGKTLDEVVTLPHSVANSSNKGNLGGLVEAHFFELPPSTRGIDFPEARLELKTTGLVMTSDGSYRAKERLVLTMINYLKIVNEDWETSVFYLKCKLMLILFYLYEKGKLSFDQRFVLDPILYRMSEQDEIVIRRDWEFIKAKVRQGKAHEISEGDTYYLGACRKGAGGPDEPLRPQPFSEVGAKARAFSFKPSYINTLIQGQVSGGEALKIREAVTFEEATELKFKPYINLSIEEISSRVNHFRTGNYQKGFNRELALRILAGPRKVVAELEKAGIELKTIRLKSNGAPKEAMSFPGFKYLEIVNQEWEESTFFEKLESRFLFIVFREDNEGIERLDKVLYWNMPYEDRLEAQRVWEETKRRVAVDATNLPRGSESRVAHVRPKAKDARDTIPTPQGAMLVKKCFWLNRGYIQAILETQSL
jgi:DNA mismatch repair protein MutH